MTHLALTPFLPGPDGRLPHPALSPFADSRGHRAGGRRCDSRTPRGLRRSASGVTPGPRGGLVQYKGCYQYLINPSTVF